MEATTAAITSNRSLFGDTLDNLLAFRAAQLGQAQTCGGCGRSFPTGGEVFSHDCDHSALPRTMIDPVAGAYQVTARGVGSPVPASDPIGRPGDPGQLTPVMARPVVDDRPIDPAKVEAWLLGLGRKVEDPDVTPRVKRAAAEWIGRQDVCHSEFMAQMQERAAKGWALSAGQARGLLNIWRADLLKAQTPDAPQAPAQDWTAVPAGRYAYTAAEGTEEEHTAFCKVEHGEGRWAGRVFVRLLVGAPGQFREMNTTRATAEAILAKIAADPRAAAVRFGHEVGQCGRCNSPLTDPDSIARGIGPVCAAKAGW